VEDGTSESVDDGGRFAFADLSAGDYVVVAAAAGATSEEREVRLLPGVYAMIVDGVALRTIQVGDRVIDAGEIGILAAAP